MQQKSKKIVSTIHQKFIKNQWKWGPWGRPGATLGVFEAMLVASDRSWPYFGSNLEGLGRILAPRGWILGRFGLQVGVQNGQNRSQELSEPLSIRWSIWRLIFEAIWREIGSILGCKILPKWSQVGCKIDPSLLLIWELFWEGFRYHFSLILYTT